MAVSLGTIADPAVLRRVWRDVRSHERQVHLTEALLVRDSTGGLAFDLSLQEALPYLRIRILDGSYRPHPPLVVEAAKSKLLRRRLSFLSVEDALILGALVQAVRPSLMKEMQEWVSFGRIDEDKKKTNKRIVTLDYEGWWVKWLRYRKLLKVIEDDPNPLLVISDITNFFGSVDLSLLRSKVSGATSLDSEANDLLFYLLDRLRPSESYGPMGSLGLPVVADDTSRVLAHFYLGDLDQALFREGKLGRYTRWVDDLVVSVHDEIEGGKVVATVERALSRIGLVANSSKTTIVTKAAFRRFHFEQQNEYLDEVHEKTRLGTTFTPDARRTFEAKLSGFLDSAREGYWDRVLRRYYTESRRLGSKTLLRTWEKHLTDFPSDAQYILDYSAFSPGSLDFCMELFAHLKTYGPLFEDILILAYEALLLKPFPDDPILRGYVARQTYYHFLAKAGFERPSGYVEGLQALVIYKFGGPRAVSLLAPHFANKALENPVFASYAFPVLAASNAHRQQAFEGVEHIEDSSILRIRALIERLEKGDARATGMMLGLLEPKFTNLPIRAVVNPRVLPLLKVALRSTAPNNLTRIKNSMQRVARRVISTGDPELIDWVMLSHLQ